MSVRIIVHITSSSTAHTENCTCEEELQARYNICIRMGKYTCRSLKRELCINSVFNQLDAQNLFHNKFYFIPLHASSTCVHHQEVKIVLHSLWYHHTETSELSKMTKIQFYKYILVILDHSLVSV